MGICWENTAYIFIVVKRKNDRLSFCTNIQKSWGHAISNDHRENKLFSILIYWALCIHLTFALATNGNEHNMNLNRAGIFNAYLFNVTVEIEMILKFSLWNILMGNGSYFNRKLCVAAQRHFEIQLRMLVMCFFCRCSPETEYPMLPTYIKIDCYANVLLYSRSLYILNVHVLESLWQ